MEKLKSVMHMLMQDFSVNIKKSYYKFKINNVDPIFLHVYMRIALKEREKGILL